MDYWCATIFVCISISTTPGTYTKFAWQKSRQYHIQCIFLSPPLDWTHEKQIKTLATWKRDVNVQCLNICMFVFECILELKKKKPGIRMNKPRVFFFFWKVSLFYEWCNGFHRQRHTFRFSKPHKVHFLSGICLLYFSITKAYQIFSCSIHWNRCNPHWFRNQCKYFSFLFFLFLSIDLG